MELKISCADRSIGSANQCELLAHSDLKAVNTWEQPDAVRSESFDNVTISDSCANVELPPQSFAALSFSLS